MKNIFRISGVILLIILIYSCKKEEVPVLTTTAVSGITGTTATSGGTITSEGSGTVISRGVCWSTGISPTIEDSKTSDGSGGGSFTSNLVDLEGGTIYYVRAYASNSAGTGYGTAMTFTTLGQAPTASTLEATNISVSTVALNGNANANYISTVVTFEYGTTINYGSTITASQSPITGSTSIQVSSNLTDLAPGTTYHFRIKTENSRGIIYGSDQVFTTLGQSPAAITLDATTITKSSATLNGTVNANYLSTTVTFEYGSTISYGQIATAKQSPVTGSTNTNLSADITGLASGATYHYRIVATNSLGTINGADKIFTLYDANAISDYEGNYYTTVSIGTQVWMKENLRSTKYNDGTPIPNETEGAAWGALSTPAYCWYGNDAITYKTTYGALYNWFTVNTGKLCPINWHVPSDSEWTILTTFLGGESVSGGKLKEAGSTHWSSPNTGASNDSGFTGLPGGNRWGNGPFDGIGTLAYWWSSTEVTTLSAWYRQVYYNTVNIDRLNFNPVERSGFSVRCVKD